MWTVRASLVGVVSLVGIVLIGLSPGAPAAAAPPQDAIHEVMPGDDLRLIAGYYYGDTRQWERIWQANRDQISNPNRIERGALLRIPDAVVPAEPYADFVARARQPAAPAEVPAKPEARPVPEVEPRIAGEKPPTSASPKMEPTTPPASGAPVPAGPPAKPGAPTGPPAKRP